MATGWKRCSGGLVKGDLFIASATRGGVLYQRATEEQYNDDSTVNMLLGEPWGDPSYGREIEAGPIADLKYQTDNPKGHWYTRA